MKKQEKQMARLIKVSDTPNEDVYDLEIEDNHNFFANTILAHNCEISLKACSFCNLVEVNVSNIVSQEDLNNRVKAASFIATLQASYTDFHFLRAIWKKTAEEESLIGVSMTGIADGEVLKYDLKEASKVVLDENERVSKLIGINKARRATTIKPSGNSAVVLKTSSGIHARYAPYYWRRMRIGKNESLYTYLSIYAPELLEDDLMNKDFSIVKIAIKSPKNSIFRNESPIDLLERVKRFHSDWISGGHRKGVNKNNVSCTVSIKNDEWEVVGDWMWKNREHYNGLSVLPYDGGTYIQTPFEECTELEYLGFIEKIKDLEIDLDNVIEDNDETNFGGEVACGASGCEVK
jgi:ribonucleoside-diphosphate reductase alpha chain